MHSEWYRIPEATCCRDPAYAAARRAHSRRRHHHVARAGIGGHRRRFARRQRGNAIFSSVLAFASRWSIGSSPTFICRVDAADAGVCLRRDTRLCCERTGMPSPSATAFSAMETRCCSTASPDRNGPARRRHEVRHHRSRWRCTPRSLDFGAWHRRHAGVHAGRHLRRGEGCEPGRHREHSARRSCSPTRSTCGCARAWK